MERVTIDFGIDLGTTNSTIAVIDGTDAKVIPNKAGSVVTPSAIWIDKRDTLYVGAQAKERAMLADPENGDFEFKLRMGLGEEGAKAFSRSGRSMLPEELSAEVLKSLKMDVQTNMGEALRAAVITVPAAFELPQTDATRRAACGTSEDEVRNGLRRIAGAGFEHTVLLLEPVAASLAYGFQSNSDNAYWFVYDFGGGTFDAALMQIRDGQIQVVNHDGDNHLGGKLLDWDIVTEKIIPALVGQFDLPDFRRGNIRWRDPIGKLKYYAEQAKIEVCRTQKPSEIWIEGLCEDASGKPIDFSYNLTPQDVQDISVPFIERSLNLCRQTLRKANVPSSALDRILMVGGTTLNPWVRDGVQSALGAKLEFGVDPVTAVARGAAIFAGIQNLPDHMINATKPKGNWLIEIQHAPVGDVPDPEIGGRLVPPSGEAVAGCTVEFVDVKTGWRSGRVAVAGQGVFLTQLAAEEKRRCEYEIELCDPTGTRLQVTPSRVTYTIGVVPGRPPVSNTIGIRLANGDMMPYLVKGTPLPARGKNVHRTTALLRHGNKDDVLRINVLEGEHNRADYNNSIGSLLIRGTDIRHDLPAGEEVEVTLSMDVSQKVRAHVLIGILDEDFEKGFDLVSRSYSPDELELRVKELKQRLRDCRNEAEKSENVGVRRVLARVENENIEKDIDHVVEDSAHDAGSRAQLNKRLQDLAAVLDEAEQLLEVPRLKIEADEARANAADVLEKHGTAEDKRRLAQLLADLESSLRKEDAALIRHSIEGINDLWTVRYRNRSGYQIERFGWRKADHLKGRMTDSARADALVEQGERIIAEGNAGRKTLDQVDKDLAPINGQLASLVRGDEQTSGGRTSDPI